MMAHLNALGRVIQSVKKDLSERIPVSQAPLLAKASDEWYFFGAVKGIAISRC